ncbi:MFS transporter [Actinotalea sp. BY-33]|uniref:MFS transporter n=1 Tax=Actinotalea soli TaxID=2819234 RepID=A0A939LUW0_9CELL|nr:MFS transporter [Actinotalea soli]MBO1753410.1 MFS transporter [Actinotalea soli]
MSRFGLFVVSRAVSWVGNALTMVTLPVLVYQRTGDPLITGLLAAFEGLPYLVLGLPAGALVDRWGARRTMLTTTALSAVAMASIPVADRLGVLSTTQLLLVALATSSCFVFFDAGSFGAVPALVGRGGIGPAMAKLSGVSTVIGLAGPAAAGVLLVVLAPVTLIAVDAATYVLSLLLLLPVRWNEARSSSGRGPLADIAEGLRYLWQQDVIRVLTLIGTAGSLAGGAVTGLLIVLASQRYGLGPGEAALGLLYAAGPAGALLATVATPRLQRRLRIGTLSLGAWAVACVALLALSLPSTWWLAAALLVCWQLAATVAILHAIIVRQTITPMPLQSRVNTTARMIAWGGQPLGAAAGGAVAATAGLTTALVLAALCCGVAVVGGATAGLRRAPRLDALHTDDDGSPPAA